MMNTIKTKCFLAVSFFFSLSFVLAQSTIKGKVKDLSGTPIPGVNVILDGTTKGSQTDFEGNYTISNVENGTYIVKASYLGYAAQSKNVSVNNADVTLNGSDLISAAQTEKEGLITELKEILDTMSRQAQLERKAAESTAMQDQMNKIPLKIYIG